MFTKINNESKLMNVLRKKEAALLIVNNTV